MSDFQKPCTPTQDFFFFCFSGWLGTAYAKVIFYHRFCNFKLVNGETIHIRVCTSESVMQSEPHIYHPFLLVHLGKLSSYKIPSCNYGCVDVDCTYKSETGNYSITNINVQCSSIRLNEGGATQTGWVTAWGHKHRKRIAEVEDTVDWYVTACQIHKTGMSTSNQ